VGSASSEPNKTLETHPVNEGTLGVEQVELVVQARPSRSNPMARFAKEQSERSALRGIRCRNAPTTHEVVLANMQSDLETLARSPPGTSAGGSLQKPSLKPVGHQSTNLDGSKHLGSSARRADHIELD
jgi:hypothetical protein